MRKLKTILRSKKGESTPMTIALVLGLLLLTCAMAEFFRLRFYIDKTANLLYTFVIQIILIILNTLLKGEYNERKKRKIRMDG